MRRKMNLFALGMAAVITLSACQKSPDSSIVKNKDLDGGAHPAKEFDTGSVR